MEPLKILKIFYTAWIIIFVIIFLTRCKSNPNQIHENIAIDNTIVKSASDHSKLADSVIGEPRTAAPSTTSVAVNNMEEPKPVKLIYLK